MTFTSLDPNLLLDYLRPACVRLFVPCSPRAFGFRFSRDCHGYVSGPPYCTPRRLRFFSPAQRYFQSYRHRSEKGELTRNYVTDGKRNRILEVK